MKLDLDIHPSHTQEQVRIEAPTLSSKVLAVRDYVQGLSQPPLTVKQGQDIYQLEVTSVYRLYLENRVLQVRADDQTYRSNLKLYQAKEILPERFLQISQSEIIHLTYLDHVQLTAQGLVKLVLTNGDVTYSSRRYLSSIKEALGL